MTTIADPMPMLRLLLLLTLLCLTACTDPRGRVIARLGEVKLQDVRNDVAKLHTQYFTFQGTEFFPVRPENWPASIQKLRPLRMTLYRDGLAIAIHDEPGLEFGIHITPPGDVAPPKSTPRTLYEPLQEGVYFYTQKR